MLGYTGEELAGQSSRMIYSSQEEYERVGRVKYGEIAERGTGSLETRFQRKDGQVIDVLLSSTPLDPADLSKGVTFTALDITERKQAEEALHLTQFCVDRASVGIMRTGSDAQILSVNDQMCRALGYTAEKLCTMHVYDIDLNFPLEKWRKHRERLRTQGSDTFETVHRRKDGTTFPVEITNNYIEFQGEGFSISFTQDITERKQAEEEREHLLAQVQEQAQRVQQIIETVPEGVILLDTKNRVIMANPLGHQELAALADTLVGGTLTR